MFPAFTSNDFSIAFSAAAVAARTAAASQMLGAIGNDDLKTYQAGAAAFLANSPSVRGLPVWAFDIVVTPKGHLVNVSCGGEQYDVVVDPPGQVPDGCTNPVPGTRNVTNPNAGR